MTNKTKELNLREKMIRDLEKLEKMVKRLDVYGLKAKNVKEIILMKIQRMKESQKEKKQ